MTRQRKDRQSELEFWLTSSKKDAIDWRKSQDRETLEAFDVERRNGLASIFGVPAKDFAGYKDQIEQSLAFENQEIIGPARDTTWMPEKVKKTDQEIANEAKALADRKEADATRAANEAEASRLALEGDDE